MTDPAVILLGSNLGPRETWLARARAALAALGTVTHRSAIYETAPWGLPDQPAFLNQVVVVAAGYAPEEWLEKLLQIERDSGRIRGPRWAARTLDLDLLFLGDRIWQTEKLTLPHPRLHERRFTVTPLAEILPDFVHPVLRKTCGELLQQCPDPLPVTKTTLR
ncbi:MAG: 2-amino-4-hydroxy-6-hydroxymethyldihydropteridine diphosphokinase [Cyclobacteriaceae bacterium]|jgi:2-amino-4-hydroxy-6-hydroxymethyldihydropteridine diphosphokinase|nr:2-amino-4-hydroxy-6-hydroxymethyldihydropteridine diphosphokinase [Cyclobacteriaceae bacterium]